jgi:hypothetical protein
VMRLEEIPKTNKVDPPAVAPSTSWQRWAAVGAFAGGAVAAGVGTYGLLRYNDRVGSFNGRCDEGPTGALDKMTHQPDAGCADLQSQYQGARTLSIVGFSVAGALAATGVVLLVTAPHSSQPEKIAWACAPQLLRLGASCQLRF